MVPSLYSLGLLLYAVVPSLYAVGLSLYAVVSSLYAVGLLLYADVIGQDIGCLPGEYEIKIDSTVAPVVHAPRAIPVAIREQVKKSLPILCSVASLP